LDVVNAASLLDVENVRVTAALERAAAELFQNHVAAALEKMKALNADAAGFGASFRRSRPQWWREMRDHWPELLQQVQLLYDIDVVVVRTGLATRPAGPEPHLQVPGRGGGSTR